MADASLHATERALLQALADVRAAIVAQDGVATETVAVEMVDIGRAAQRFRRHKRTALRWAKDAGVARLFGGRWHVPGAWVEQAVAELLR